MVIIIKSIASHHHHVVVELRKRWKSSKLHDLPPGSEVWTSRRSWRRPTWSSGLSPGCQRWSCWPQLCCRWSWSWGRSWPRCAGDSTSAGSAQRRRPHCACLPWSETGGEDERSRWWWWWWKRGGAWGRGSLFVHNPHYDIWLGSPTNLVKEKIAKKVNVEVWFFNSRNSALTRIWKNMKYIFSPVEYGTGRGI